MVLNRILISIVLLGITGCGGAPEAPRPPEVADSAGIRVVQNTSSLWRSGEEWNVSAEPTISIGSFEGTEEYQFVDIVDATRLAGGRIAIADAGTKSVRVFGLTGTFLKTLGGPGFGPGEFQDPRSVLSLEGGGVQVWDGTLFRSTVFGEGGELVSADAVDLATIAKAIEPPLYPASLKPLPDGGFLVRLLEKAGAGKGGGVKETSYPVGRFRRRSGALRVSSDLMSVDTVMFFADVEQLAVEAPWGVWPIEPPLARRTWIAEGGTPHRICIGEQQAPEIACFHDGGSLTLLRWSATDAPATEEEISAWRQEIARDFGQKLNREDIFRMLELVPAPEVRPPHSSIHLDPSGNLWVNVGPTPTLEKGSWDYRVFGPDGVELGLVRVPRIDVLEIGEDYLLGVFQDELEVEYLHVYGLSKSPSAN